MKCMILVNLMGFSSLPSICHSLHGVGAMKSSYGSVSAGREKGANYVPFFLNFTVTIQFDFFKIPQLFWRPFVNLHIFPVIAFLWNYKHPGAPVVITITIIFYLFFNIISVIFTISYKSSLGKYFYHSHDGIFANGGRAIIIIVINFKLSTNF